MNGLHVRTFGEFSITYEDRRVSDSDNRSRKVWPLLAYLICHRNRLLKQHELIDLLWGESEQGVNPAGALKTLFYRVRSELDKLWPGAGKQLIVCQGDGYIWNKDYPVILDCEEFDRITGKMVGNSEEEFDELIDALNLYQGEFLERMSSELWVIPIATYYHNFYIHHLLNVLPKLLELGRNKEAIELCRIASGVEPFHEKIHWFYMRAYLAEGNHKRAVSIYQKLSDRLLSELGIMPSEEIRSLYHEATKTNNEHLLSIEMLQTQLKEDNSCPGALVCEYDFFRVLYYSMARSVARSGIAVHIALLSIGGKNAAEMSGKKIEKVMTNLEGVIACSLRRGDSAARCSATQYVVMLPRANYENSCMVCERIMRAYYRKHSYSDAEIRYEVCALQPDDKESFQWIREQEAN